VDSSGSGYGSAAGFCQYGDENSGSIKGGNLLIMRVTISFSRKTLHPEVSELVKLVYYLTVTLILFISLNSYTGYTSQCEIWRMDT
jgi:hypothetical protein